MACLPRVTSFRDIECPSIGVFHIAQAHRVRFAHNESNLRLRSGRLTERFFFLNIFLFFRLTSSCVRFYYSFCRVHGHFVDKCVLAPKTRIHL